MKDARLQDLLSKAQRNAEDPDVRDRIIAVKCVLINKMTIRDAGNLLCRAPSWVSGCVTRFEESGRDPASLETKPKSGRPPTINWDKMMKHLSKIDPSELTTRRIMEIIHQKTGTWFTTVHVRGMMERYGFTLKNSTYVHPSQARTR